MHQIIDPETHDVIDLYSDRVNQLLKTYQEKDILDLKIITPLKYNRNTVFVDDILYTIMLELNIKDIKSLCQTDKNANKICHNTFFWEQILKRDNLYFEGVEKSLKDYELLHNHKIKIDNLILHRIVFKLDNGLIDAFKILSKEEFDKIIKERYQDFDVNYIEEFVINKSSQPGKLLLFIVFVNTSFEITLGIETIKHILLKTLYYYPNIVIEKY